MKRAIKIQGTEYPLKFGFGAFRLLGRLWNLNGMQSVMSKIQAPFEKGKEEGTFEQFEIIGALVWAGISNAGVEDIPEENDIIDDVMLSPDKIELVMAAFTESIPQQGNPQPRKKPGKKGAKKS